MFYYLVLLPLDGSVQVLAKSKHIGRITNLNMKMLEKGYCSMAMNGDRLVMFLLNCNGRVHA